MNDEKYEEDKFSGMDLLKKVVVVCIGVLFILIPVAFIVGIYFFGFAGFFSIFGIRVESVGTLLIFVAGYFLLALFLDIFAVLLFQFISPYVSGESKLFFLRMVLDCTFSWFALHTVNELMTSIDLPFILEVLIVLFIFLIEEAINNNEERAAPCSDH